MSDNQRIANTETLTAEQAKQNNEKASGKSGAKGKGKGGIPPAALIIVAVVVMLGLGSFIWMKMNQKTEVPQETPQETPQTIDDVGQGIRQTQQTYNPSNQKLTDNKIEENTSFFVDDSIVFKDVTTGQYMITYKNMPYPIDSDLGKEAILYYKNQGTDPLVLLQRLKEKDLTKMQNAKESEVDENTIANAHIKAENEDLRSLVELQDKTIKELKSSLITIANNKAKESVNTTHSNKKHIPKDARSIDAFAVVGDRAWLTDSNNRDYSVSVGDKLPNGETVLAIDSNLQIAWVK